MYIHIHVGAICTHIYIIYTIYTHAYCILYSFPTIVDNLSSMCTVYCIYICICISLFTPFRMCVYVYIQQHVWLLAQACACL